MRNNTPKSNGFGRYELQIVVRVNSEHVETFSNAFNTKPFRTAPEHSDFTVQLHSKKHGDDETIMYEIDYRLPDLPSFKGWKVLWDESIY